MKQTASDATVQTVAVRYEARMWREESTGTREERQTDGTSKDVPVTYPAEWAVYDVESGVRPDYAKSEEAAIRTAGRWNDSRMPEAMERKAEAARYLRTILQPGMTLQTILRHCSRSRMMRHISVIFNSQDISWYVANLLGDTRADDGGIKCGGCGMDMGFHLVYTLSRVLFPDGFDCPGESCPIQ